MPVPTDDVQKRRIPPGRRLARYGVNLLRAPFVLAALRRRFGGPVRFAAVHRVALQPELGLAYNRVKKNANTTLTILLRELSGGEVVQRDLAKWEAQTPFDLPLGRLDLLQRLRYMVVVRNPYSRTLSAFLDKFREPGYQRKHGAFPLTPDGFAQFVAYLDAGGLRRDAHWDLQTKLILAPLDRFDAVLRFETLGRDLEAALAAHDIPFDASLLRAAYPSDEGKSTGAAARVAEFYRPETAAIVARLFARDFAALGYATDLPGARPPG